MKHLCESFASSQLRMQIFCDFLRAILRTKANAKRDHKGTCEDGSNVAKKRVKKSIDQKEYTKSYLKMSAAGVFRALLLKMTSGEEDKCNLLFEHFRFIVVL